MSLRFFHILFISLTTLMLFGGGWLAYSSYREEPAAATLATAWVCAGCAVYLLVYGFAFLRKTRKIPA